MSENNDALSTLIDDKILFGMDNLVNKMKTKNTTIEDMLSNKSENKDDNSPVLPPIKEHIPTPKQLSPFVNETAEPIWTAPKFDMDLLSNNSIKKDNNNNEDNYLFEKPRTPSINTYEPDLNILNPIINDEEKNEKEIEYNEEIKEKTEEEVVNIAELLAEWEDITKKNGSRNMKQFNSSSDPNEIKLEIKKIRARKARETATRYMSIIVLVVAKAIEALSKRIKIVNVNITGWSAALKHNMSDFDDIFSDLYEVHFSSGGNRSPIVRLINAFFFSAMNFYIMNQGAEMLTNFMNNKAQQGNQKPHVNNTTYRNMTPPDMDLETEELLAEFKDEKK